MHIAISSLCALCISFLPGALGYKCLGTLSYNFTLTALNTTLPNSNRTGVPLVLGHGGSTTGASVYVTSTYASYPYNDFPVLTLSNHSLHAFTTFAEWFTNATAVSSGQPFAWLSSKYYTPPATKQYGAVLIPGYEFSLLTALGTHKLWSLCPSVGLRGQTIVVFNATQYGSSGADCYPVVLQLARVSR